jgi:hypothetical protein
MNTVQVEIRRSLEPNVMTGARSLRSATAPLPCYIDFRNETRDKGRRVLLTYSHLQLTFWTGVLLAHSVGAGIH